MISLSTEQTLAVKEWLEKGASLSEVQKSLKDAFGLALTYLDVRLLVMDIGAAVKDKPEPKAKESTPPAPAQEIPPDPGMSNQPKQAAPQPADGAMDPAALGANVSVSVDTIQVPGALVSGSVTFSDGTACRWMFDSMGRFGFEPGVPGYKPTAADMEVFQRKLQQELSRRGY